MKTSAAGIAAIEQREGCRLAAYQDTEGNWTIGVGLTTWQGHPITKGLRITQAEADAEFARQLPTYEGPVNAALGSRQVSQNTFDACVSLCFNIGPHAFAGSTVARRLIVGDMAGAADAFLLWEKPAVLKGRREAERSQFLMPDTSASPAPSTAREPAVAPAPRPRVVTGTGAVATGGTAVIATGAALASQHQASHAGWVIAAALLLIAFVAFIFLHTRKA